MPLVTYVGPADSVYVPALGAVVLAGEPVDVEPDVAVALLDQPSNWQPAPPVKPSKPAPVAAESKE